jgi:hypothetical protein
MTAELKDYRILVVYHESKGAIPPVKLFEELKKSPGWAKPFETGWLIATRETPDMLWRRIAPLLEANDYTLIVEPHANYIGSLPKQVWEWMKPILPRKPD